MLYDDQADTFDERAGIPPAAVARIADAAAALAGAEPGRRWLEVGAGTGLLSLPLVARGIGYTGFDRSPAMLDTFRARLADAGLAARLVAADGNGRWPAEDASVDVVFGARALHHLEPAHAAAEARRVLAAPGGCLVAGRVHRPPDSPKAEMRRAMRRALKARGIAGRSHERGVDALFAALGGEARTVEAARWSTRHRPADSVRAWAAKEGLAGEAVDAGTHREVLEEVAEWARERYGDPERPLPQEERFELRAVFVAIH